MSYESSLSIKGLYLQRLKALREEAFPIARQMAEQGRLDFDQYVSDCGTYRCLLGWWAETPTAQRDGWYISELHIPSWDEFDLSSAEKYFNITYEDRVRLFGDVDSGSLDDRLEFLNKLIADRQRGET